MTAKEKHEDLKQRLISDYEKLAKAYVKSWGTYLDVAEYPKPTVHRPVRVLICDAKSQMAQEYYVKSVNVSQDASRITVNEYWNTPKGRKVQELGNNSSTFIPLDYNLGGLWDIINAMKEKMGIICYREHRFLEYENIYGVVAAKMEFIMKRYGQKELTLELDSPIVFNMFFDDKKRRYSSLASNYIGVLSDGGVYYYWDKESMETRNSMRRSRVHLYEFNLLPFIDLESILLKKIK